MELKRYLMIMLRHWWLVLTIFVVTFAATTVFTYLSPRTYETVVRLVVSPTKGTDFSASDQRAALDTLSKATIVTTYAEIAQSPSIVEAAWRQVDDPLAQEADFQEVFEVNGSVLYETNIVVITVNGPDPEIVHQLAAAVSERTLDYVTGLYEIYDLKLLDPAELPTEPVSPDVKINLALGGVLGLGGGALFAFLVEYLRGPLDQVVQVSLVDVQTGAYTSTYLLRRIQEEISRSKRVQRPFTVGIVHLADLEEATAELPPDIRQGVMKQIVSLFKQTLSEENLVAQWGEHDLAILMPDCIPEMAQRTLERLQNKLEWTLFEIGDTGFKLNLAAQIGLATYTMDNTDPKALLEQAEQALKAAYTQETSSHSQDEEP